MRNKFSISLAKPNRCIWSIESQPPRVESQKPPVETPQKPKTAQIKQLSDESPAQQSAELDKAEAALNEGYERSDRIKEASEKLTQNKNSVSLIELKTLATKQEGREAMRKSFTSGEVSMGKTLDVNFGNNSAEWNIGAGDLLSVEVREISVKTKDGKIYQGSRWPNPENPISKKVGYYTTSGEYIPIFSGDQITINKITTAEDLTKIDEAMKKVFASDERLKGKDLTAIESAMHEDALTTSEKNLKEALAILEKSGISDLEHLTKLDKLAAEKIERVFTEMSGKEVWQIRNDIGADGSQKIFAAAGLENKQVDLKAIKETAAKKNNLPPNMLGKIMHIESSGKQFAVSPTGALGCMQLTKWIYHDIDPPINPFDPQAAVQRAADHLADLYRKYGEDGAVRAYNQGESDKMNNTAATQYLTKYRNAKNILA